MKARKLAIVGLAVITLTTACGKGNETATAQDNTVKTAKQVVPANVIWFTSWDEGMAAAKETGKPVFVHFTADWCKWCVKMKKETYAADEIKKRFSEGWITIMMDTEDRDAKGSLFVNEANKKALTYLKDNQTGFEEQTYGNGQIMQFFGGQGLPTLLFIDKEGAPLTIVAGYKEKAEFGTILDYFQSDDYKETTYEEFLKKADKG